MRVRRLTEIAIVIRLGVDAINGIGSLLKRQVVVAIQSYIADT